jgi:hypothetical protein
MPSDPFAGYTDNGPAKPEVKADPFAGYEDRGPNTPVEGKAKEPSDFIGKVKYRFEHPPEYPSLIGGAGKAYRAAVGAVTLPGDVYAGKVDPLSKEAIERSADLAMVAGPINPAVRSGDLAIPGVKMRGGATGEAPNVAAARTANELEAPLPVGIASPNKGVQAVTQAARQFPEVGAKIDEGVNKAVEAAGENVQGIASDLSQGVNSRAGAGGIVRPSLQGIIDSNNVRINEAFGNLRGMIDPEKPVPLPSTTATLKAVLKERAGAGSQNPLAGLEDVKGLTDNGGAGFNGLQRARTALSNQIKWGKANPGFDAGDLIRLRGAMSQDMESLVRQNARGKPAEAAAALKEANAWASQFIEQNKTLQQLTDIRSEEGLMGSLVKAANDKTGNLKLLGQLRATMPKEDFEQISGTALSELGHNPTTGEFSLNKFTTNWNKMGDQAKGVLFTDPNHVKRLNDIARLGEWLKNADKYQNTSNTGRAVILGGVVGELAHASVSLAMGEPMHMAKVLGGLGGGYVLARTLARPAGASAIARWARAAESYGRAPSPAKLAVARLTGRDAIKNLVGLSEAVKRQLLLPPSVQAGTSDRNNPPPQGGNLGLPAGVPGQ